MPSIPLTAGRITACWFSLRTLHRLGGQAARAELVTVASRTSLRSGGLPIRDGIRLAVDGGLIAESPNELALTELGTTILTFGTEDEPSELVRRVLLTRLLLADPPAWVAYWQGDPAALDLILPANEGRTLAAAGLLPVVESSNELNSWAFWRALGRVPLASERTAHLKRIGDAGEQLSIDFERRRLHAEGHHDLAQQVRWVAQESDAYGFDILSYAGGPGRAPEVQIAIEVKATSVPVRSEIHFYLSSHEWETASEVGEQYRIHVWTNVDPGPPPAAAEDEPRIVSPATLVDHMPLEPTCSERCRWQSAEIFLSV